VGSIGGGGIAVIPVVGTITQRAGMMTEWCGGTSTQQISAALAEAMRDEAVGQILMEFDTPGGSVFGVAELGDEIHEAAKTKPVIGVANSLSASAGYWLMSQCSQAYVTPGGEVGSIGVWMAHEDWSKAMAESGVVTTMVSAGKFKVEGNPYEPLGEDARAFMQSRVDDYYGAFVKAVARGRGVGVQQVRDGMGQGRVLGADEALAQGMVDGVAPVAEVVRGMQRQMKASSRPARSAGRLAAIARRELELLA
jgi:signal peptide peptidase SppA